MEVGAYDLPHVDAWATAFAHAVNHTPREVPTLAPAVAGGRVGLWQARGRPVAMAYTSRANGAHLRICLVGFVDRDGNCRFDRDAGY